MPEHAIASSFSLARGYFDFLVAISQVSQKVLSDEFAPVPFEVLSDEFEPVSICRGNREPIRNKVDATR